jgi:predicted XRE-type DNA-binding protein
LVNAKKLYNIHLFIFEERNISKYKNLLNFFNNNRDLKPKGIYIRGIVMIKNERQYKYSLNKLQEFKSELNKIKEQYKNDEQGLKMFSQGYIEHIAQLQDDVYRYEKMKNNPLPQEFIIRSLDQINKYLVWLRLGRNITQTHLAKLIKCKQSDISRFERDNYNKFSLYTLKKIIKALGSTIEIRIINEKHR